MTAYVYVVAADDRHHVNACDGDLSAAIGALDKTLGKPVILLWAEAVSDYATAQKLAPLIEALEDEPYADLLAGRDEAASLLRE